MPFEAAELVRYIPGERVARECVGSMFSGVPRTRRVCDAATQIIYLLCCGLQRSPSNYKQKKHKMKGGRPYYDPVRNRLPSHARIIAYQDKSRRSFDLTSTSHPSIRLLSLTNRNIKHGFGVC